MKELEGLVTWVTGAASGIGNAICEAFYKEGAKVVASDINEKRLYEKVVNYGPQALPLVFDISDFKSHDEQVHKVKNNFGSVDALVNCAGIEERRSFPRITLEHFFSTINTNLGGAIFLSQRCLPLMHKNGVGSIINISSVMANRPLNSGLMYSISKSGLDMFTKGLAVELAPLNIRVNGIAPGAIQTPMTKHLDENPSAKKYVENLIPLGRLGTPDDISQLAVFLASNRSSYITGSIFTVDGGMSHPVGICRK